MFFSLPFSFLFFVRNTQPQVHLWAWPCLLHFELLVALLLTWVNFVPAVAAAGSFAPSAFEAAIGTSCFFLPEPSSFPFSSASSLCPSQRPSQAWHFCLSTSSGPPSDTLFCSSGPRCLQLCREFYPARSFAIQGPWLSFTTVSSQLRQPSNRSQA